MELRIKRFDELTARELYAILRLREAVFVDEQNCHHEIDGRDQEAVHIWLEDEDGIAAYLRVFAPERGSTEAVIGRVIAARRRRGLGTRVMEAGIRFAKEELDAVSIHIEAQCYAVPFYERLGFAVVSDVFLEENIPHVEMRLSL